MSDSEGTSTREPQTIRRAAVTYGRRATRVPEPDTSATSISNDFPSRAADSVGVLARSSDAHEAEEVTRRHKSTSLSPALEREDSGEQAVSADNSTFQWDWQKKLREIDEGLDKPAASVKGTQPSSARASAASSTRQSAAILDASDDILGGPLPESTESSPPTRPDDDEDVSWSDSPVPQKRVSRRATLALPESDDEQVNHRASSHTSSPHPFSINTPSPRSSATPPTSLGISAAKGKTKGKERAVDVSDSDSEREHSVASAGKDKKRDSVKAHKGEQGRKRVKRPTKKEREETRKTTARMIADQAVSLPQGQAKEYRLRNFLQKFEDRMKTNLLANSLSKPNSSIPESDPIQPFSSSPMKPLVAQDPAASLTAHAGLQRPSTPTPMKGEFGYTGLLEPTVNSEQSLYTQGHSSDEELPDLQAVLQEDNKKRMADRLKQEKLRLLKQQEALPHQTEDDSDLEIVQDDAKVAIKEEAKDRRVSSHKPSVGRQRQLAFAQSSVVPRGMHAAQKGTGTAKHPNILLAAGASAFAKPTTEGKDRGAVQLSKDDLNRILLRGSREQSANITRQKEEEWKRRGGKLKDWQHTGEGVVDVKARLSEFLAAKASTSASGVVDMDDAEEAQGSDDEYHPDGEFSGEDQGGDNYDSDENVVTSATGVGVVSEDDTAERASPLQQHRARRRVLAPIGSDDEDQENRPQQVDIPIVASLSGHHQALLYAEESVYSLEERTEEGTDKENDESLKFDAGEDKENTLIVLQPLSSSRPALSRSFSSLREPAGDPERSPLKELPSVEDDDDPFLFTPSTGGARKLVFAPDQTSPSAGSPSADGLDTLFEAGTLHPTKGPGLAGVKPGGLSQLFTPSGKPGLDRLRGAVPTQDLSLTLDVGLQPALEVNENLRRKADDIFEKEQDYLVVDVGQAEPSSKLYINDHGFLTQTRPDGGSPEAYRLKLSSQLPVASSSRAALADTLATTQPASPTSEFEILDEHPRRRLIRRGETPPTVSRMLSHSPTPQKTRAKNAFDLLKWGESSRTPKPKAKVKLGHSEFIEGEAQESDDDVVIGFGGRERDDDGDNSDDEDQDQTLAELVDDSRMDVETLAEDAVLEKVREHLEEDDKTNEKVHMDAIHGKLRTKRRRAGLDFEDSDSDDEDEHAKRLRQKAAKKRKIDGDTLEALAKNEDTMAFVKAYNHDEDEDEDFAHMQQDDMTLVEEADQTEVPEAVSMEQIRREGRERGWDNIEEFDAENVAWADQDSDQEEVVAVREFALRPRAGKSSSHLAWNATQRIAEPSAGIEHDGERARLEQWAKSERATSRYGGYGPSTGGSAVTGHGKAKSGSTARTGQGSVSNTGRQPLKLGKTSSALSAVASRRDKFA